MPTGRPFASQPLVRRAQPAPVIRISSSRLPRFTAGDAAGENLAGAWLFSLNTWDPPSAPKRRLIHLATEQTPAPRLLEPKRGRANLPHRSWGADVCAGRPAGRREASAPVGMALENPPRRAVLPSRPAAATGFSGRAENRFEKFPILT